MLFGVVATINKDGENVKQEFLISTREPNEFFHTSIQNPDIPTEQWMNQVKGKVRGFVDLGTTSFPESEITPDRVAGIAALHREVLTVPAASQCQWAYVAYLQSCIEPESKFLSIQGGEMYGIYDADGRVAKINTPQEASKEYMTFLDNNGYGGRDALGGEVFQAGSLIAAVGLGGKLQDRPGWGGKESKPIDDFLQPRGLIAAEPNKNVDNILQTNKMNLSREDRQLDLATPKLSR